jgi:U4/U6.U5 tri-snRNP component SNU23
VNAGDLEAQSVFYCKTCKVQLKDSNAWYDHINGKKHNQMLGMSMIVEKVDVERVRAKLAGLKRKTRDEEGGGQKGNTIEEIQRRIELQEKEEEERAKNKRKKVKEAIVEEEIEFNEDDITAFGLPMDFGTSKKK